MIAEHESLTTYAPDWTPEQRQKWKADYNSDKPVLLPWPEHDRGECTHCDLLRALMDEADLE